MSSFEIVENEYCNSTTIGKEAVYSNIAETMTIQQPHSIPQQQPVSNACNVSTKAKLKGRAILY